MTKPEELQNLRERIKAVDLPQPDLSDYDFQVAQMLARIYTLSRELVGRNLTDHPPFGLDTVRSEMLQCVERFIEEYQKEQG